jgi:hypothetical protein
MTFRYSITVFRRLPPFSAGVDAWKNAVDQCFAAAAVLESEINGENRRKRRKTVALRCVDSDVSPAHAS